MDSPSAAPAALSGRRVALLGGFLLLGALAFALWLLLGASPASAQSSDPGTPPGLSTALPASPQEGVASESDAPPVDLPVPPESNELRLAQLPIDLPAVTQQVLPPVTQVLPPPVQPVVSGVVDALPAPVRAPLAPVVAQLTPPPPPSAPPSNAPSGGPALDDPATSAPTPAPHMASAQWAFHAHHSGELRSANVSSPGDDTHTPPTDIPLRVAASSSSLSNSPNRDSGSSLLLFGVLIAGVVVAFGRGRRLLTEALGWLPAPWCALIERPG